MLIASIVKELKLLSRDLHGVAVLFMMPVLFMLIMSAALSNDNALQRGSHIVFVGQTTEVNQKFVQALKDAQVQVQTATPEQQPALQTQLQRGDFELLVVNPNAAEATLNNEKTLQLWLNPSIDRTWLLGMQGVLQKHYTEQRLAHYMGDSHVTLKNNHIPAVQEIQTTVNDELDTKFNDIKTYLARDLWQEVYVNRQGSQVSKPSAVQHSVPAWLIFGMFFIMIPLSNVMASESQTNTITRLRMARASAAQLIAAKMLPYFLINQLQFVGMVALGYWVLPMLSLPAFTLSGPWWPYAVLAAAVSWAALGYGLLISVVARTTEQAVVLGGGGIIIMAAIGGIMVPTYVMPPLMQTIAQYSPMGWALAGFQNLLLNQATLEQIARPLGLLIAFGSVCLTAATLLYRRKLQTQVRF